LGACQRAFTKRIRAVFGKTLREPCVVKRLQANCKTPPLESRLALQSLVRDIACLLELAIADEEHALRGIVVETLVIYLDNDQLLAKICFAKFLCVELERFAEGFAVTDNQLIASSTRKELQLITADIKCTRRVFSIGDISDQTRLHKAVSIPGIDNRLTAVTCNLVTRGQ
jgi:hypothetical protein